MHLDLSDPYEVFPFMVNPFNPPEPLHWLICPTHQVWLSQIDIELLIYIYSLKT